ncbi:translation initiation factor IF-1A [Candidatus Pacearchaeota archaeon]|nr:translation initiation factor IF-1A [Candidatus Pacearchaeota archaeon]
MQEEEYEFGDFEEILDGSENEEVEEEIPQEGFVRARWPKNGEIIGTIVQRYGGNRMEVLTTDGKTRNCRVPGKYKRQLWLRPKDIVLVKLWEFDKDKGDIIYKYKPNEVTQLKKKGLLNSLNQEF